MGRGREQRWRPFDVVIIGSGMFGGYFADHIIRNSGLRVLVLDAGPFLVSTHLQNLPGIGLFAPNPIDPASDPGTAGNLVWGMPWRGDSQFVGQAYCVGGKSLFWGGWCPTLLDDDLNTWANFSPSVAQYLRTNYPTLQRQVGILDSQGKVATNYIEGPLFAALKAKVDAVVAAGTVPNLDTSENAPLAVQGEPPASGLFPFDKYSSIALLVEAVREAAARPTLPVACSSSPTHTLAGSRRPAGRSRESRHRSMGSRSSWPSPRRPRSSWPWARSSRPGWRWRRSRRAPTRRRS